MARATSSLPVPLSPGDEHRQIVSLQALNLRHDARHRRARRQESRQQRLERRIGRQPDGPGRPIARGAQRKPLLRDGRNHAQPPDHRMAERPRRGDEDEARPFGVAPERLEHERSAPVRVAVQRRSRERARRVGVAAGEGDDADVAVRQLDEQHRAVGGGRFEQRRRGLAPEQIGQRRRIHDPPHDRIVGIRGRDDVFARADLRQQRLGEPRVGEVAFGAELLEDGEGRGEMALGDRAGAGFGHEPSEREMAQGRLIALAEQIQQRRALREVVIRIGRVAVSRVQGAAQAEVLAPRRRGDPRIQRAGRGVQALLGPRTIVRGGQRFGGDQRRLQRVNGRRAGLQDLVGERHRFVERPAPQREPRAEHADRPLVPVAGLAPVGAVRVAGPRQKLAGRFVAAAYQMNLRQRVEDGAGRFVKLNRAADLERPVERLFGARQIAEAHANLPERAERDREAVARAVLLVQRHAALGERERLFVAVLQHHDARLIAADGGEHVVGMHDRRKPLGLTERGHRFVVASQLGERDARQRMHERQVAAIARRVESGRGFGDVLAHGRGVADVAVALAELVVREPDAPRSWASSACLSARPCSAIARDWSPRT